jgi:hypothetical protein
MESTVTIPANKKTVLAIPGRVFFCIEASNEFKLRADNREKVSMNTGKTYGSETARAFSRLIFYNTTANDINVTFYAGFEDYQSGDVTSVGSVTVAAMKDAATYSKSFDYNAIGHGQTFSFNGLDGTKQRKQIVICNNDSTGALEILDNSNLLGAYVQPKTAFTLVTNAMIRVRNLSGAEINFAVLEIFYSS